MAWKRSTVRARSGPFCENPSFLPRPRQQVILLESGFPLHHSAQQRLSRHGLGNEVALRASGTVLAGFGSDLGLVVKNELPTVDGRPQH